MSKTLDKVSKLLTQAENAGTPEEAEAFMAKVQELASINGIDLAVARLHQAKKERAQDPEERRIAINPFTRRYNRKHFIELAMAIAQANDVEYLISGGDYALLAVGFPSDLDVLEALYTHLSVQMATECDDALKRGENREERNALITKREEIPHEEREWGAWNGRSQYYDDDPKEDVYIYRQDNETDESFAAREQEAGLRRLAEYEEAVKNGTEGNWSYQTDGWRKPVPPPRFRDVPVLDDDGNNQYERRSVVLVEGRIFRNEFYDAFVRRMRQRLMEIKRSIERERGVLVESSETALALRDKKKEVKEAHEARYDVKHVGTYKGSSEVDRKMDHSGRGALAGSKSAERVPIDQGREVKR